jgi:hypothetical protein
MTGIILKSTMFGFGIATLAYCINIALAQIDPSAGQSTTSLSQPLAEQPAGVHPASGNIAPAGNTSAGNISAGNIAPAGNTSAGNISGPAVNSTTIGIPESPTIVGPSSYVASPITSEANDTNSTG